MAMTLGSMAEETGKSMKKDTPMKLERMSIEPAEGGMIARCSFEGHKKGEHQYRERVKVFENAEGLAKFILKAFKNYGHEDEEEEE